VPLAPGGNTFGPKGLSIGSSLNVSSSKITEGGVRFLEEHRNMITGA
jgi:hypothetical protein